MTFDAFESIMAQYRQLTREMSELYDMGFDFFEGRYNWSYHIENIIATAYGTHYTEAGVDWIEWFMHENDFGDKDWSTIRRWDPETKQYIDDGDVTANWKSYGAHDEKGNPICYDVKSLWEYVEQHHRLEAQ